LRATTGGVPTRTSAHRSNGVTHRITANRLFDQVLRVRAYSTPPPVRVNPVPHSTNTHCNCPTQAMLQPLGGGVPNRFRHRWQPGTRQGHQSPFASRVARVVPWRKARGQNANSEPSRITVTGNDDHRFKPTTVALPGNNGRSADAQRVERPMADHERPQDSGGDTFPLTAKVNPPTQPCPAEHRDQAVRDGVVFENNQRRDDGCAREMRTVSRPGAAGRPQQIDPLAARNRKPRKPSARRPWRRSPHRVAMNTRSPSAARARSTTGSPRATSAPEIPSSA